MPMNLEFAKNIIDMKQKRIKELEQELEIKQQGKDSLEQQLDYCQKELERYKELGKIINYPEDWDTACYDSLYSALLEYLQWAKLQEEK